MMTAYHICLALEASYSSASSGMHGHVSGHETLQTYTNHLQARENPESMMKSVPRPLVPALESSYSGTGRGMHSDSESYDSL